MMIKLKDILTEFDYGKELFGRGRDQLIYAPGERRKLGIDIDEPNTSAEEEILEQLYYWVIDGSAEDSGLMDAALKILKRLKPKFPEILDPKKSKYDYVYRGATIPFKYILKAKPFTKPMLKARGYVASNKPIEVPTKATRGWVSFTSDPKIAEMFFGQASSWSRPKSPDDPFPCILKVSTKNQDLLFNPEWLQYIAHTGLDEQECLYLTDKFIKVDSILINETTPISLDPGSDKPEIRDYL